MKIIKDDLYFCADCTFVSCNGPYGLDITVERLQEVFKGIATLSRDTARETNTDILDVHIVPDFDSNADTGIREFSNTPCSACKTSLAGYRARFAILGR